jgi:hypothetical protein
MSNDWSALLEGPWFCGIEHLTYGGDGYIRWKGQIVEHYTLCAFPSVEAIVAAAQRLAESCKDLPGIPEPKTVEEAVKRLDDEVGDPYEMTEGMDGVNNASRALIRIMEKQHGQAWLVNINLYDDRTPVWAIDERSLMNFCADAVMPTRDAEVEAMILARHDTPYTTATADYQRLLPIYNRIREQGGHLLAWS